MRYLLLAQLLLLSSMAFGGDKFASCELASTSIVSRSYSGVSQVSNLGEILITCRVPERPFPTTPGEGRDGLKAATVTYKISTDGGKKLVPSEVHPIGGGFGRPYPEQEWVDFYVHIPLERTELDAEARRFLGQLDKFAPKQIANQNRQQALARIRDSVFQHQVGHFRVECRVLDGDRVMGIGFVEFEVIFKGRFSDVGLFGAPPA